MSQLLRSTATPYTYGYRPFPANLYRARRGTGRVPVMQGVDNRTEYNLRWPRSRLNGIDGAMPAVCFNSRLRATVKSGGNATRAFSGITRDTNSDPLGSVTVKLFRTATNELIAEGTSNAGGEYTLVTPYSDGHFVAAHKTGSPVVSGMTDPTIVGS